MPKSIEELKNAKRNVKRVGGKKIEFGEVVKAIIASGKYWPVTEVHTQLVHRKVGRYRTMRLLNAACTTKKLERLWNSDGKFYYGAPLPAKA